MFSSWQAIFPNLDYSPSGQQEEANAFSLLGEVSSTIFRKCHVQNHHNIAELIILPNLIILQLQLKNKIEKETRWLCPVAKPRLQVES